MSFARLLSSAFSGRRLCLRGDFPEPYNTEPSPTKPMAPEEAAAKMKLPPGFKATIFAAEPDVQNPIAMAFDGRGRNLGRRELTYAEAPLKFRAEAPRPHPHFRRSGRRQKFASRKVFTDGVQMLTSIELGRGGVWAMCPPQLLFIPDQKATMSRTARRRSCSMVSPSHRRATTTRERPALRPGCWLTAVRRYGARRNRPARDAAEKRVPLRGGMWRYHPERHIFETLAAGTTNPWGTIGMPAASSST